MALTDFESLVAHYRATRRALPWRDTRDPYAILVSELMLQQTRVETVLRFYERFLERFPTARSLAEAPEQEVLAAWAGLGYYRRARLLQKAAAAVQSGFPTEEAALRQLPGIGPYTAASLASIAFEQPAVALDGNALRVLTRYFGEEGDPNQTSTRRRLTALTRPHIPAGAAGDFTQAVMELGATLCAPRPRCGECPLKDCLAHRQGRQHEIPAPRSYPTPVEVRRTVVRVEHEGRTLLISEPQAPILAGLWHCPYWESEVRLEDYFENARELGEVRHGITFRRIIMRVFRAGSPRQPLPWVEQRWVVAPEELPVPAFVKRIYRLGVAQ